MMGSGKWHVRRVIVRLGEGPDALLRQILDVCYTRKTQWKGEKQEHERRLQAAVPVEKLS